MSQWLHDVTEVDVPQSPIIDDIAIPAALAQYGRDRTVPPTVVEIAGTGSSYLTIPGFNPDGDSVLSVEYPARQNPPIYLDQSLWTVGRDPADVSLVKLVLYASVPPSGQWVRVTYTTTGALPFPTEDPATDEVDDGAFVFVAALAASYTCVQLLTEAMRDRQGSIPTDFVQGNERATMLQEAADRLMNIYRMFMGLPPVGQAGGVPESPARPAWARTSIRTGGSSLFHRGP